MAIPRDTLPRGGMGGDVPPTGNPHEFSSQPGPGSVTELQQQMTTVKAQVDALQISLSTQRRSQWLQSSTIIAVLTILVTLATYWHGNRQQDFEQRQADRVELTGITQRLSGMRLVTAELWKDYSYYPGYPDLLAATVIESQVLADRASELIARLDSGFTGNEHFAVADVYQTGGFLSDAHRVATEGLAVASSNAARTSLLRKLAIIEATMSGDPAAVAKWLRQALDTTRAEDRHTAAWIDLETEKVWASLSVSLGDCATALEHAQKARDKISDLSPLFVPDDPASTIAGIDNLVATCSSPGTSSATS